MGKLPTTIIQHMYEHENIYKDMFDKVLKQMTAHCFIQNSCKCFKPWNNCYCYCEVCKTYLNTAIKYFTMKCEHDLAIVTLLGLSLIIFAWSESSFYYLMDELKRDETVLKGFKVFEKKKDRNPKIKQSTWKLLYLYEGFVRTNESKSRWKSNIFSRG